MQMHIVHFRMSFSFFERIFSSATEAETTHISNHATQFTYATTTEYKSR